MLEGQFYNRLILNIVIGIMFVYALVKMAQRNNQEIVSKKHIVMKVFGWIFVAFGVLWLISCLYTLVNIKFPHTINGPVISSHMIVRPVTSTLYWGYPTIIQKAVLSSILSVFSCFGIGGYFLFFKSSRSRWWKKILKFIIILLLYSFMVSSTDFHYFDLPEFIAPILFVIIWSIIVFRKSKNDRSVIFVEQNHLTPDLEGELKDNGNDEVTPIAVNEDHSENFIPESKEITTEETRTNVIVCYKEDNDKDIINYEMQYCRYCGKKIESDSSYCKYCGKKLQKSNKVKDIFLNFFDELNEILTSTKQRIRSLEIFNNRSQNACFKFSLGWVLSLGILFIISLGAFIGWVLLFKYQKVRWLGDSYDTTLVLSCFGIVFVSLSTLLCIKQEKKFRFWRKCLIWFSFIISVLGSVISASCLIDTICSFRLEEAKNQYNYNKLLDSSDLDVINGELNRRFEYIWNASNSYSTIEYLMVIDTKYFDVLNQQAHQDNGMAQGILGEYYFATGRHQIINSQDEYGYMIDEKLYEEGQNNIERAFYWWKKASENNDARGMYRIGNCYANIIKIDGISKDLNQAYQYWKSASEKDYGMAYKRLGDLFGTWEYLGAFSIDISNDKIQGVDVYSTSDDNPKFSKPFPLPDEWRHDLSIARDYWQKAVECGGASADEARRCLEKVYPEEKSQDASSHNYSRVINKPIFHNSSDSDFSITSISLTPTNTILECCLTNRYSNGWMSIAPDTYIKLPTGEIFKLSKTDGIAISPKVTFFEKYGQTKTFKLYFPQIPIYTKEIDLIEPNTKWQFHNIKLE